MEKNIKELFNEIKESNVSQRALSKAVGISPEHLNGVLNERLKMNNVMFDRIKYWFLFLK